MMRTDRLLADLGRPGIYDAELERLLGRSRQAASLRTLSQDGLTLYSLGSQRRKFARRLARTIRRGEYRLRPAAERIATIEGKERLLYRSQLIDTIVAGALSRVFRELTGPFLSPRVFSYLPGRSSWQAIDELGLYQRAHRRSHRDPRERGLFVVKRDVSAYGDSIPLGEGSILWELLEEAARADSGVPRSHPLWPLFEQLIRRQIETTDGYLAQLTHGVPTGSAMQPLINNLYLTPLDRELESIPGAFYLRYGDDFIFLHERPEVAERAAQIIDAQIARLGLTIKDEKRLDWYFNGAGRPAPGWGQFRPTSQLEHLGCRVSFGGKVRLKAAKARDLLFDLRLRIGSTLRLLRGSPIDDCAGAACAVVNTMLDPQDPLAQRSAMLLRHVVNDRAQLKELDYQIALELAQALSGVRGVKAFRVVGYRALRRRHGLGSLVVARNGRRRAEREARE